MKFSFMKLLGVGWGIVSGIYAKSTALSVIANNAELTVVNLTGTFIFIGFALWFVCVED